MELHDGFDGTERFRPLGGQLSGSIIKVGNIYSNKKDNGLLRLALRRCLLLEFINQLHTYVIL